MHFDLIQSVSLAGVFSVPNDDRAGVTNALAWVIDGATDLGPPGLLGMQGGAAWLASEAHTAFTAAADGSLSHICGDVAARLEAMYDATRCRDPIDRWELPMASFLAVRLAAGTLECAWLGDCAAILRQGDRVVRLGPPQQEKDAEVERAARLAHHGLGSPKRSLPILEELRASRSVPNKRILGVEAQTMAHLGTTTAACAPGDDLLLMSDGFSTLIDSYDVFDEIGLMEAMETLGLAALAIRLREIEANDAACERFPRFKASDDATALWLRVGG